MGFFSKRSKEASTWGGLGMALVGFGQMFDAKEAPAIAGAVEQAGTAFASGMPWWQALLLGATGTAMAFKSDGDKGF